MNDLELHISSKIKLAICQAFLGEINPSLRGVAFDLIHNENKVFIYFYHEGIVTDAIENHYSCIESEASNYFFYNGKLLDHDFSVIRIDSPEVLPDHEYWVYIKKEPFTDPI